MDGIYIQVRDLPSSVRNLLAGVGYNKADVCVIPKAEINPSSSGGDGYRAFFGFTKISENPEECNITYGSFGGPNMFNPQNLVDNLQKSFPIPEGICAMRGQEGGTRPVSATLYIHPNNCVKMLPEGTKLSLEEEKVLVLYRYTSAYRAEEMKRIKNANQIQQTLIEKGLLKKVGKGLGLTTEGKTAAHKLPMF